MKVAPESRKYTVIATHVGYFQYRKLPFGISSAPSIFQRYMEKLLRGIENTRVLIDDIVITGPNRTSHLKNLEEVLKRLKSVGARIKRSKCKFLQTSINYLGHRLDKHGIHNTEQKVSAIKETPQPKNKTDLKVWLGLVNYHERFIPNLHSIAAPLHKLSSKKSLWKWTADEEAAMSEIKDIISSEATMFL